MPRTHLEPIARRILDHPRGRAERLVPYRRVLREPRRAPPREALVDDPHVLPEEGLGGEEEGVHGDEERAEEEEGAVTDITYEEPSSPENFASPSESVGLESARRPFTPDF